MTPTKTRRRTIRPLFRWFGAAVGLTTLAFGIVATFKKDASEAGTASLFVLALVFLMFAIAGRLPTQVSLGKDHSISWAEASKAVTEKNQEQVTEAAKEVAPDFEARFVEATDPEKVRAFLIDYTGAVKAKVQPPTPDEAIRLYTERVDTPR